MQDGFFRLANAFSCAVFGYTTCLYITKYSHERNSKLETAIRLSDEKDALKKQRRLSHGSDIEIFFDSFRFALIRIVSFHCPFGSAAEGT